MHRADNDIRIHRGLSHRIDRFQVVGDRCSGTNFVSHLIERNLPELSPCEDLGWKHGFIDRRLCEAPGLLTVVVYRHPVRWMQSVYRNPFQIAPSQLELPFGEFIRSEWTPVWVDEHADGAPTLTPIQADMYPHTTIPFENICRMRSVKIGYLEELAILPCQVAFVRYEDCNRAPQRMLEALTTAFDLAPVTRYRPVREYKGMRQVRYRPAHYQPMAQEDLSFVKQELDLDQEHRIGYDVNAPIRMDGLSRWAMPALRAYLRRREPGSWFPGRKQTGKR